jgi:O-methyltransferase involved in polyketide biosynthesis
MNPHQLSKTAAYVAIKFYGLTLMKPYRDLFDKEVLLFYDRLIADLPAPLDSYHSLLKNGWFRSACMKIDKTLLPGDLMHILMRKSYLPASIERLIDKGYSQVIILGAGFDHIGRTFSQKGITCVELDVDRMVQVKQRFLKQYGYTNKNLTVWPINISERSLYDTLGEIPALNPDERTVAVAEGFFDYLTPEEFSKTLNGLSAFFVNKLKLVSTVFSLQELTRFQTFVFRNSVKAVGERLKLNASLDDFESILNENDFKVDKNLTAQEMRDGMALTGDLETSVLRGFYLLEASKRM